MIETDNVCKAPESDLVESPPLVFASRWKRLGTSILDSMPLLAVILAVMYYIDGFGRAGEDWFYNISMSAMTIAIFLVIHIVPLLKFGQTFGKKIFDIKVVDIEGKLPTVRHWLICYGVYFLPAQIPVVGGVFSLVDSLTIFRKSHRCIHDIVAGTVVIEC